MHFLKEKRLIFDTLETDDWIERLQFFGSFRAKASGGLKYRCGLDIARADSGSRFSVLPFVALLQIFLSSLLLFSHLFLLFLLPIQIRLPRIRRFVVRGVLYWARGCLSDRRESGTGNKR